MIPEIIREYELAKEKMDKANYLFQNAFELKATRIMNHLVDFQEQVGFKYFCCDYARSDVFDHLEIDGDSLKVVLESHYDGELYSEYFPKRWLWEDDWQQEAEAEILKRKAEKEERANRKAKAERDREIAELKRLQEKYPGV